MIECSMDNQSVIKKDKNVASFVDNFWQIPYFVLRTPSVTPCQLYAVRNQTRPQGPGDEVGTKLLYCG
jgi:hypothetical protein